MNYKVRLLFYYLCKFLILISVAAFGYSVINIIINLTEWKHLLFNIVYTIIAVVIAGFIDVMRRVKFPAAGKDYE